MSEPTRYKYPLRLPISLKETGTNTDCRHERNPTARASANRFGDSTEVTPCASRSRSS